ncbi:hypothetical protein FNV43_RR10555 [Rhamnella rubrinervis]|uniref:Uncharacterized protein n=1 Tax=Rhamnella rubrinervis TaxID=2594499 RepID=A0A8K0H4E7_9ROSA|nr:hypothetical protein FNV43_RR10555 [Rhamnella rubrinervis]
MNKTMRWTEEEQAGRQEDRASGVEAMGMGMGWRDSDREKEWWIREGKRRKRREKEKRGTREVGRARKRENGSDIQG